MARLNVEKNRVQEFTHEGAPAAHINAEQALRRSIMSCFLWNKEFYEDGEEIAARITRLAKSLPIQKVANLAIEARTEGKLRHAPLLLLSVVASMGRGNDIVRKTMPQVIQRADELAEFLAIHAKVNGVTADKLKKTLSGGIKKGLGAAFGNFNEYGLAKYKQSNSALPIKMRDVLRMCHAKPKDEAQSALWKRLLTDTLAVPDTWEVALSTGADKKETWERLIRERKLGYDALMKNLRNMVQVDCDMDLVKGAILARKGGAEKLLPFRYIAAARAVPQLEPVIDQALQAAIAEMPVLPGKTIILVDVSGSMEIPLSGKSDLKRVDAAAALSAIWPGDLRVFTFSSDTVEVAPRRGMAGVDAVIKSQHHGGTMLGKAVAHVTAEPHDRLIVITDEQSRDRVGQPKVKNSYMINVASNRNGVGYGGHWLHLDGFSENVFKFIHEYENSQLS